MFRVEWLQDAVDELTTLWLAADSTLRQAITAAAHTIDHDLRIDPFSQSETREGEVRVTFIYPLGLNIEVDVDRGVVWVLNVWRYRRRGE